MRGGVSSWLLLRAIEDLARLRPLLALPVARADHSLGLADLGAWISMDGQDTAEVDLTAREAAAQLGVSERTVRRAITAGDLRATKKSGVFRIALADLDRFRARRPSAATQYPIALSTPQIRDGSVGRERPAPIRFSDRSQPIAPLPDSSTPFVGRAKEVAGIVEELARPDVRLVTLTGPGGVGKTRLALRAASEVASGFRDGVRFVGLAAIGDPDLVAPTIAEALGVRETGVEPLESTLASALRYRHLLLLLDNFEQVVESAPLVADLLATCPSLTALVTSRVRLRVSGERERAVLPLTLARGGAPSTIDEVAALDAVRLFVGQAKAARPGFALDAGNAATVAEVCRRVDGLPLGIELAAARVRHLSVASLLGHMERRLPLLVGGPHDQPPRLRTMHAAIAWSYDLLPPREQAFFRRVAVFTGGFSLAAAAAVVKGMDRQSVDRDPAVGDDVPPDILDLVASLIDASLLQADRVIGAEPRYQMLETIREFGLERLEDVGEADAVREAHAAYFLSLAEQAEWQLRGQDQATWLERVEVERPNLRVALGWLQGQGEVERALRLAGAIAWFWRMRDHLTTGRAWLESLLDAAAVPDAGVPPSVLAKAASGAGTLAAGQSDFDRAVAYHEASLRHAEAAGDDWWAALAILNLGVAAKYQGDIDLAEERYAASLERFPSDPNDWGGIFVRSSIGTLALDRGDLDRAEPLLMECVAAWQRLGDLMMLALDLLNLGELRLRRGDEAGAERLISESLGHLQIVDEQRSRSYALGLLGEVSLRRGNEAEAEARFAEALALNRDLGDRRGVAQAMEGLATVTARSQPERAARLFGAAAALRNEIGAPPLPAERDVVMPFLHEARTRLGEGQFAAAWAAGQELSRDAAVAEALAGAVAPAPLSSLGPSPAPSSFGLSRREQEILRLLAAGESNRSIANRLAISPATVARHAVNVYAKLGVDSRAKATALAFRHGLA